MLTDDEARRLLHHAGETVSVDPTRTVPEPPRRPVWPILVAAAAVVAIVVTSVVIASRDGGGSSPDPAPPTLERVQVPSVLGYELGDAVQALMDAGFTVSSKAVQSCDQVSTATGTEPAAGTSLDHGSAVVLQVSVPGIGYCFDDRQTLGRQLLTFADGRGPAPQLADTVRIYEDSDDPVTISRAQASDPETWRACTSDETCVSVLARLSEAAHRFYPSAHGKEFQTPYLFTAPEATCAFEPAPAGLGRSDLQVGIGFPVDGQFCTQDFVLDIHLNAAGEITAVAFRSQVPLATPADGESDPIEDLALQFHAFAFGSGDLPPIGDEVDLYVGGAFTGFVTKDTATDRKAWETCTEIGTYAGRDCPFSPLEVLRDRGESVAVVDDPDWKCLAKFDDNLPGIASADATVIVPTRTPSGCAGQFAVKLYVNDDGELIAVDLFLPKDG
jgi:hypothetical protein